MPNILLQLARKVTNNSPMRRVPKHAAQARHELQTLHIPSQIRGHAEPVPQNIIPSEQGILFLKKEAHVVVRVARREDCADSRPLYCKDLSIVYGLLTWIRQVLVDAFGEGGVVRD
ncbi:hypothetical protein CNMCM8694_007298 [Aspergillus lentulus]|nr:hypothetical protein CNMCM8694_007298 [Aspergillus lentulus]